MEVFEMMDAKRMKQWTQSSYERQETEWIEKIYQEICDCASCFEYRHIVYTEDTNRIARLKNIFCPLGYKVVEFTGVHQKRAVCIDWSGI